MMHKLINRIHEIKNVLDHLWFIESVLDIVIILLAGFLLIIYAGIAHVLVIIPILFYFFIVFRYKFNKNTVVLIEKNYPELDERLRTIYDNRDSTNIIIEDLESSVMRDIEKIKYSTFFESGKLGIRIAAILLLVAILISSSISYLSLFQDKTDQEKEKISPVIQEKISASGDNIFGEPSFVNIPDNTDTLIINRDTGSELNTQGPEKKPSEIRHAFPQDENINALSSKSYNEAIPVIYQKIVKNYFTNISRD